MANTRPKLLHFGILIPSSNTAFEPLTSQIISTIPKISVHFSRYRLTTIDLSDNALGQFDIPKILEIAQLLADAEVDVRGWSVTSAGWLGFEVDEKLRATIQEETSIRGTTVTLALNRALPMFKVNKLGLLTPYTEDVQEVFKKQNQHNNLVTRHDLRQAIGGTRDET
ncbi:hypothetical protein N0V90_005644 [Kalmusia sp. IMI 367209]|nr:hypothetical protein N0V90_005644 [Kalmusia sp. IMI 367209]